jgi:uncharacterized protein (TIGR02271 family)
MAEQDHAQVIGENGLTGIVLGPSNTSPNEIAIALDDGREISVHPSALTLRPGGVWYLRSDDSDKKDQTVIPVIAEELDIGKRKRVTGAVRVQKKAVPHDEKVSMPLTSERADVKRVLIDKPVDGPLPVRREGDTIIMPVVEEVAVFEKRMILKEEIHITRRRTTQQHQETVTLHTEQADVQRTDPSGRPTGPLPSEERSILDPSKARPSLLGSRQKPAATRPKKILGKD